MILDSLQLVRQELEQYLEANSGSSMAMNDVVLGNIAMLESEDSSDLDNKVVMSLVNIEEERALKNVKSYVKNNITNGVSYKNPPVHLNLYVLFSANYTSGVMPYEIALSKLSNVIKFFQSKSVFTVQSSGVTEVLNGIENSISKNIRLIFNIYTMTFEQLNHLWGSLGGKQVPSVMYRAWLVELEDEKIDKSGALIEHIISSETIE